MSSATGPLDAYGQSGGAPVPQQRRYEPLPQVPADLTVRPGTFLTIRVDQAVSSDHNNVGDGFFATFDGPARAVRCACAIVESVRSLGIEVRAGLHTGECELIDGRIEGLAVHIGARVAALATAGEILASSTVKDLVAGSGLAFRDRGVQSLKGVPGEWHLFAVLRGGD